MPPKSATIDALLAQRDLSEGQARASVQPCQGAKFHSPTPLLTNLYERGDLSWWLCGNCTANLEVFLALAEHDMPWEVLREFGNGIRSIGQEIRRVNGSIDG